MKNFLRTPNDSNAPNASKICCAVITFGVISYLNILTARFHAETKVTISSLFV